MTWYRSNIIGTFDLFLYLLSIRIFHLWLLNLNIMIERLIAHGHLNILGTHKSTLEITKENHLTKSGDCIIGISSDKACADLTEKLRVLLRTNQKFQINIECGDFTDSFYGFGHPQLTLSDTHDIVFRKSDYKCRRTIMINCNKAAADLNRNLIKSAQNPRSVVKITIKSMDDE